MLILKLRITRKEKTAYMEALWRAIEDEACVQWIARYLVYDVDLRDWSPEDIPQTRVRSEQQELNVCPVRRFVESWQSDEGQLYYTDRVAKKDAMGWDANCFTGTYVEQTHKLEADANTGYNVSNLFSAFKFMCKNAGLSMCGISNANVFAQRLAKYLHDGKHDRIPGFQKKRESRGVRYYMSPAPVPHQ